MDQTHQLWHFVYDLPWSTIGTYLLTSGVVAAVFQVFKKHVTVGEKKLAERTKALIVPLAGLFSLAPVALNYLVSQQGQSFTGTVPREFAFVFTGATALHAWLISPGYAKLSKSLAPYVKAVNYVKAEATTTQTLPNTTVVPNVVPTTAASGTDFNPVDTPPLIGAQ